MVALCYSYDIWLRMQLLYSYIIQVELGDTKKNHTEDPQLTDKQKEQPSSADLRISPPLSLFDDTSNLTQHLTVTSPQVVSSGFSEQSQHSIVSL